MNSDCPLILFLVEQTVFEIRRDVLLNQIEENQKKIIQEKLSLPSWVTLDIFRPLQKYLNSKSMDVYKQRSSDTTLLIHTLRLTDILGMTKFQQKFISQIITNCLSISNCVTFLQQTHRKLRNQENGSQCWYSLLNASITYLAVHLKEVYQISSDKLKRLNEKIINQILDRTIRNGNFDQSMIFELVMQSRKAVMVDELCQTLRTCIQNKKINPRIHAKLSWKLQDVANITDKKTKVFKFIEYEWLLEASRGKLNELIVKLNFCGIQGKVDIGAFYIKVIWWIEGKSESMKQEPIKIEYLLMNNREDIQILTLSEEMQKRLAKSKIELSIFCCMDQIYTFTLNYLANHYDRISDVSDRFSLDQRKLTPKQLQIIVSLLKQRKQYSSSIRFLKFLSFVKGELPQKLFSGYPLSQLTPYEIDFIQKMNSQKLIVSEAAATLKSESSEYGYSGLTKLKKLQQRSQSKGRLRKIFASSPSKSIQIEKTLTLQMIIKTADMSEYFYDKNHPLRNQL